MYDAAVRSRALARLRAGDSVRSISTATGINRSTLREWRERVPYLYLLGQYLGDGCISKMGRTWVLRIATCDAYPAIRDELVAAPTRSTSSSAPRLELTATFEALSGCDSASNVTVNGG